MPSTDGAPVADVQTQGGEPVIPVVTEVPPVAEPVAQEPTGTAWEGFQTALNAFFFNSEGNFNPFDSDKVRLNEAGIHMGDLLDPTKRDEIVEKLAANPVAIESLLSVISGQKSNLQNAIDDESAKETPDTANIALIQQQIADLEQVETVLPVFKEMSEGAACFVDAADKQKDLASLATLLINTPKDAPFPTEAIVPFMNLAEAKIITPEILQKLSAGNEKIAALSEVLEGVNSWQSPEARAAAFDLLRDPKNLSAEAIKLIVANVEPEELSKVVDGLKSMGGEIGEKAAEMEGMLSIAQAHPELLEMLAGGNLGNMPPDQALEVMKGLSATELKSITEFVGGEEKLAEMLDGGEGKGLGTHTAALLASLMNSGLDDATLKNALSELDIDENGNIKVTGMPMPMGLIELQTKYLDPSLDEAELSRRKTLIDNFANEADPSGKLALAASFAQGLDPQFLMIIQVVMNMFSGKDGQPEAMVAQGAEQGTPAIPGADVVAAVVPSDEFVAAQDARADFKEQQMAALLGGVDLGWPPKGETFVAVDVAPGTEVAANVGGNGPAQQQGIGGV